MTAWLFALLLFPAQSARQHPPRRTELPLAPVERITANVYRVGKVVADTRLRTVTCDGEVNMNEGALEYLAVTPGGKTHESLIRLSARPLHLHLALLLLDLEPRNVLRRQGDRRTPQGAPVTLWIRWSDIMGREVTVRAETLIREGKRVSEPHTWVFTGSRIRKEGYAADLEGSVIALWHDPDALIDNPSPAGAVNGHTANTPRVPKPGTRIQLIVKAEAPTPASQGSGQ